MNSLAVKKGREYMDANHPGWRERINWDIIDLRIWGKCILGQGCKDGVAKVTVPPNFNELGFNAERNDEANQMMIELWKKEINDS